MCSGSDLYTAVAKQKEQKEQKEQKSDQQLLLEKRKVVTSATLQQKELPQREVTFPQREISLPQQKELVQQHELQRKIVELKLEYLQLKLNMQLVLEEMNAAVGM